MIVYNKRTLMNYPELLSTDNSEYLNQLKSFLRNEKTGSGIFNTMLRKLPLPEMHLKLPFNIQSEKVPNGSFNDKHTYSFCGPGTKLQKRLNEGYKGVNSLDRACREHDIFYSTHSKTKDRNNSDDILEKKAAEIAIDPNEPEYVRTDAKLVNAIMAGKSYVGLGVSKNVKVHSQK